MGRHMTSNIRLMIPAFLLLFVFTAMCVAEAPTSDDSVGLTTEYTYILGKGDSEATAKALALFGAKIRAVVSAAKYLTHKDLLNHYGRKQHEIFCLTADEVEASVLDEDFKKEDDRYFVKVRSTVRVSDFVKAEIRDSELETKERKLSYREEMGQMVIKNVDPGRELSRAYRHLRKREWRIAIIYLDHLGKKYPHWGDLYLAKAIGYYGLDDSDRMMDSLETACALKNQEACDDLKMMSRTGNPNLN